MAVVINTNLKLWRKKESLKFTIDHKFVFRAFFFTFLFCLIISIFLFLVDPLVGNLIVSFILSLSIGFSSISVGMASLYILYPKRPLTTILIANISMAVGIFLGNFIGRILIQLISSMLGEGDYNPRIPFMVIFLFPIGVYLFLVWENYLRSEERILEEKMKRLETEKQTAETNLRLLYAQIEPHFLFNTLSNTRSLLDTNLEKGKMMLDDLTQYLRATLSGIREETATIDKEIAVVRAYIDIFKIRLGDRLEYAIDIPVELKDHLIPSMLIQPLVENAIKHGIEPKVDGGRIMITASREDDILRITINDDGLGLSGKSDAGVGLTNIRERLHSLFDTKGRLILEENIPMGVKAIIEVPYGG